MHTHTHNNIRGLRGHSFQDTSLTPCVRSICLRKPMCVVKAFCLIAFHFFLLFFDNLPTTQQAKSLARKDENAAHMSIATTVAAASTKQTHKQKKKANRLLHIAPRHVHPYCTSSRGFRGRHIKAPLVVGLPFASLYCLQHCQLLLLLDPSRSAREMTAHRVHPAITVALNKTRADSGRYTLRFIMIASPSFC